MKKLVGLLSLICLLSTAVIWLTLRHTRVSLPLSSEEDIASVSCCTAEGDIVLVTINNRALTQSARLFNPGSRCFRDLASADQIASVRVSPDRKLIAISTYRKNRQRPTSLQIFSESAESRGEIKHPNGYYFEPLWDRSSQKIFFQMVRPEISEGETGGMVYTDIGVLDIASMQVRSIPLTVFPSYLSYCPRDNHLYASRAINENAPDNVVDIIDVASEKVVATRKELRGTIFSANCSYYAPQLHEGGLPWEVYEAAGNTRLKQYANPSGDVGAQFDGWHPEVDGIYTMTESRSGEQVVSVLDVHRTDPLAQITIPSHNSCCNFTWSADGKSLIFIVGRHLESHRIFP